MDEAKQREIVDNILARAKEEYGFVPLVTEVMSERPDMIIPYSQMSANLLFRPHHMDRRTAELAAISAAAALGSENCLNVHIRQAMNLGVSAEAVMEALLISSFMSMNCSNSVALRCLKAALRDKE